MRRWTLIAEAFMIVGAVFMAACAEPTKAPPVPGRVAIAGDSIVWQAYMYGGDLKGADVAGKVYPGWTAKDAQPRVTQDVAGATTSPDVEVVEFGHNYVLKYGQQQSMELLQMVVSPHDAACVVLVLPDNSRQSPVIDAVRRDLQNWAQYRARTFLVDWSTVVAAHPEYRASDLIHLNVPTYEDWQAQGAPYEPAAHAFMDMIWDGVAQC